MILQLWQHMHPGDLYILPPISRKKPKKLLREQMVRLKVKENQKLYNLIFQLREYDVTKFHLAIHHVPEMD